MPFSAAPPLCLPRHRHAHAAAPPQSNKGMCHLRAFKLGLTRQFSRNRTFDGCSVHTVTFQPSTQHAPVIVNCDMSADDDVGVIRATCPVERVLWTDERARCRFVDVPPALYPAVVDSGRFPEAPRLGNGDYVVLDGAGRPCHRQQELPVDDEPSAQSRWALVAHSPVTVATGAVVLSRRGIAVWDPPCTPCAPPPLPWVHDDHRAAPLPPLCRSSRATG